jgi:HEAT repeat protein
MRRRSAHVSLDTLLPKLEQGDDPIAASELAGLSAIDREGHERFLEVWRRLSIQRRRGIIDTLADLVEDNVELDFNRVFLAGLFDDDVQVRAESIKALWEYEGGDLAPLLTRLLADPEAIVRSEAALALGRFLLRAELDDTVDPRTEEIESALRAVVNDPAELAEVRGRALEALGVRSHEWVRELIDDAYAGGERRMQISAVHAMGRSADPEYLPTIMEEMQSDDGEMRFEAATAAGAIADEEAIANLAELADDEDAEVQEAAIASLGEIGGPASRAALHQIAADSKDERILEAVSEALAQADFADDPMGIALNIDRSIAEDEEDGDDE